MRVRVRLNRANQDAVPDQHVRVDKFVAMEIVIQVLVVVLNLLVSMVNFVVEELVKLNLVAPATIPHPVLTDAARVVVGMIRRRYRLVNTYKMIRVVKFAKH